MDTLVMNDIGLKIPDSLQNGPDDLELPKYLPDPGFLEANQGHIGI